MDDTSSPNFESLLTPRLENGAPLIKTPESAKWRIIAETVEAMYKLFFRTPLNAFNQDVAEVYDTDLGLMMEAMDQSPSPDDSPEYEGSTDAIKSLGKCRSYASTVAQYFNKSPAEHQAATQAAMDLQETLKEALEYITPISDKLNPSAQTNQINAN
jgi:hypothetical protein